MKRALGFILAVVLMIGGIIAYKHWSESQPYPTWQVTRRSDFSGLYHSYHLLLVGRGAGQYAPTLSINCENGVLQVQMFVGLVERIGGGMESASLLVSEYHATQPNGTMTGTQQGWIVPQNSVMLERPAPKEFIAGLVTMPWFIASAGPEARFHVEGLKELLPELDSRCQLASDEVVQ